MKPNQTHFVFDVEWREGFNMCSDCPFNCLANACNVCSVCSHFDFDYHPIIKFDTLCYAPCSTTLSDFENALHDICVGWIGEEIGWEEYIKSNAAVLLGIAKCVLS